jgi:hypothetical protein
MPASQVMKEYKAGKLHSGSKHGKVVRNKKQAVAIQLSELRKEGKIGPRKGGKRKTRKNKR